MARKRSMTTQTRPQDKTTKLTQGLPERRYLPELHGVRGLALLGVVLFHLFGNGRISGGIDIFLAVSGFLFTGMLLREAANSNGRIDFFKYFGRLVRRIFVPLAIVAVVTLVAGLLISPVTQHRQHWAEARASLLYFENFELINSQLAYGAAGPETSPFQHIWSLSVQGQFYLLWPFVAILAVLLAKVLKTSAARIMGVLVAVIFVVSFVYAIYVGSYNQDEAYLMTTTRAWELAFGGLLALAGSSIRLPKQLRGVAGWLGVALIATCGIFLDGAALFPGPWAFWPIAGLTLVLISAGPDGGNHDPKGSATHFLSNKALAWIGDRAYGLYLWHWPILIYYMEVRDREAIGSRGALVILMISTVLALLMYRYIEKPLKDRQNQRSTIVARNINKGVITVTAAGLIVVGAGATMIINKPENQVADVFSDWDWDIYPGATATAQENVEVPDVDFLPAVEDLPNGNPDYYSWDCRQKGGDDPGTDEITVCEDPNEPEHPEFTVVLAGGSHAGQWHHAWRALAEEYNWELQIVDKSGCAFGVSESNPVSSACNAWQDNFIEWLDNRDVDLVVTPGTRMMRREDAERISEGAPERWQDIGDAVPQLLLTRGTPRPEENTPHCLASGGTPEQCGANPKQAAANNPLESVELPEGASNIDLDEYICPQMYTDRSQRCSSVVGNVAVWNDNSHLSNTYVETMTPLLEAELSEKIGWLFDK